MFKKIFLLFPSCLLCLFISNADASKIYQYKLNNGLKLLIKVDKRAPVVISQIWYKIGSCDEYLGITGISHVLEHMMFQGSKNYPPGSIAKIIAENGGKQNAATSEDYTYYYQELPSDKLALSFAIEADRMQNLNIAAENFIKELAVVKEERRLRTDNNPQAVTLERFMATANIATAYHNPVVGWMQDLNQLTDNDVKTWYQKYYAPNNAILIIVGNVQPKKVYQLAQKYFSNIKPKIIPRKENSYDTEALGKRTVNTHIKAELPFLILGFNVPSLKTLSKKNKWQAYALELIAVILAGGNSNRFNENLVKNAKIASYIDADYNLYSKFTTTFNIYAVNYPGRTTVDLENAILKELDNLKKEKISQNELEKAKIILRAENVFQQDYLSAQATTLGQVTSVDLPAETAEKFLINIEKITATQIQKMAQEFFIENRLTIATLEPK